MGNMVYLAILADPTMSKEQKEQEKQYKKYVDEHKSNVEKAWSQMKSNKHVMKYIKSFDNSDYIIATVNGLVAAHDMSKYDIEEWEPYRRYFYSVNDEEKEDSRADFEKAWEHHYMNNLHHWDYWARTNSVDKMPIEFVIEMCCDWIAMSIKFGGTAYNWYNNQKNIVLGKKQKEWTVTILQKFYDIK